MHQTHDQFTDAAKPEIIFKDTSTIARSISLMIMSLIMLMLAPHPPQVIAQDNPVDLELQNIPEYHKLSNEKLLEQTQHLYHEAAGSFRAHMRGFHNSMLRLENARTESDHTQLPAMPDVDTEQATSLEYAKSEEKRVKIRLEAYRHQLELIQTEQALLEKYIEFIKQAQLASTSLEDTMDVLKLPLHEIELRVQDETLTLDNVPKPLQDFQLVTLQAEVTRSKEQLQEALEAANTELQVNTTRIDEAKKVIAIIDTLYTSVQERYAQQLKRQELLKQYTGQTPETLLANLTELHEEMVGLNGSLRISQRRFIQAQDEVKRLQSQIDALKAPDHQLPQPGAAISSDEASQVNQKANAIVTYHTQRVKYLRELEQALDKLIQAAEVMNGDAVVFKEHIFRMRLPAEIVDGLVEDGSLSADRVPETFRIGSLAAVEAPSAGYVSQSSAAIAEAQERRDQIVGEIKKSQTASIEVAEQLEHVEKLIALAEQARQWEQGLKDLTAEQVASRFQDTAQQNRMADETLKTAREAFEQAQSKAQEEREKFDSLTDPLLRLAQRESVAEKSIITKKLYGFAELDLPAELKDKATDASAHPEVQDGGASTQETEQYQNLLSTRRRILEERDKQRDELQQALTAFKQAIQAYLEALNEEDHLAHQQYANAVELKKRIGRQQLQGDAIPDGITEALNRDRINQLETEIADRASQQAGVEQQIEALSQPDENFEKLRMSLDETITAVGKRLDLLKDLEGLKHTYQRTRQDLSEVEQTSLAQAAIRRAEMPKSREEAILSFVPSAAADGVTDVLKVYYQELIELETKQVNLQKQIQVTERIIALAETEKASIGALLPVLKNQVEYLENQQEAAWVRIQAQLMPKQAVDILNAFEDKTGQHIAPPPPIPEDERASAITQATEHLFERHTEVVAATKWLRLFEGRLAISGLDGEIGKYQDQVGALNARNAANQRHIHRLTGYPLEALTALTPEEQPKTEADRRHFLQGDIGVLRRDRSDLRQQSVIDILIKLAIIVVSALILAWIVGLIFNRMSKRANESATSGSAQTLLVISLFKTILRSAIWITAIVLIMNALGFNIGAVLAGLGIGGLAVAMAARETLADIIGGVMVFAARPFVIGDSIQVASGPVAKVSNMSWRTTTLVTTADSVIHVPNSQVANSNIQNYSRITPAQDTCTVYVSAEHPSERIESLIHEALSECTLLLQDQAKGGMLSGVVPLGEMTVASYWAWYYLSDYHNRYGVRQEVWQQIMKRFAEAGIELEIKTSDEKRAAE